jgi:hypothetical protein
MGGIKVPSTLESPTAIAYVSEKPIYRIEIPNAVPPIPYAAPRTKECNMASLGAARSTAAMSGMVNTAPSIGSRNQQKVAWVIQ